MTGKETERVDALLDELLRLRADRDVSVQRYLLLRTAIMEALQHIDAIRAASFAARLGGHLDQLVLHLEAAIVAASERSR